VATTASVLQLIVNGVIMLLIKKMKEMFMKPYRSKEYAVLVSLILILETVSSLSEKVWLVFIALWSAMLALACYTKNNWWSIACLVLVYLALVFYTSLGQRKYMTKVRLSALLVVISLATAVATVISIMLWPDTPGSYKAFVIPLWLIGYIVYYVVVTVYLMFKINWTKVLK
jgi:hypothetical protein